MRKIFIIILSFLLLNSYFTKACSVVYYVDKVSGKIYVANHEDYWYDIEAYIQLMPRTKKQQARLWYGWDNFAQGGVNEAGLFFDGAVTPKQERLPDYGKPKGNFGDEILAKCRTVEEALDYLEAKKVALDNAHMIFGDSTGDARVVEWIDGKKQVFSIENNHLVMTNFLLGDTTKGNYPCYRYASIEGRVEHLIKRDKAASLLELGNVLGGAAQPPAENGAGRAGGTLYSTFINISDMEFVLIYKLDNAKYTKLDLITEFAGNKKRRIKLE